MFPKTGRYGVSAIEDRAMSRRSSLTIDSETHNTLVAAREAAKKAKDHELSLRIRAIILLGVLGKKKTEVAEICEIGLTTVYLWQRKYKSGGIEALRDNYKPKKCSLSEEAQNVLSEIIMAGPEAAGLDTGTWTAALVGEVIKDRFGTVYSVSAVTKLLHRLNFSAQIPQVQLARADPKAQKKWQEKTYPAILRRARKDGGRVFFSRTNASSNSPAQERPRGPRSE